MKSKYAILFVSALLAGLSGCGQGNEQIEIPPEEQDLVSPFDKADTGYYSDQATEIQGLYTGQLVLDLSDMSESERQAYIVDLGSGGWKLRSLIGDQIKYGKKQLNTEKLHINLSAQDIQDHELTADGTSITITYSLGIETIVSREELEEAGIDLDTLTNKQFPVRLPADPRDIFERVGDACASGFDEGSLASYNYFYYFEPEKDGCSLQMADASFTLQSLLPQKTTYPEYNRLTADGKVTVAVFFGAAGHEEEVSYYDEGMREHREFVRALESRGFNKVEELDPKGVRYSRTRGNLEEYVDVVSPTDLHALKHDTDGLFKQAVLTHEVIIYDGHSFYGSLNVLRDKDAFPPDTYQILFMNSCWSYEYYTKQVFEHKASADDPLGWELADVVNNTEAGWFLNMGEETRILLTNLFAGCESGGIEGSRQYTWDGIIEAMNHHALQRFRSWSLKSHEIYGVSGVRTNCYDPENPDSCKGQGEDEEGESVTVENNDSLPIPDDDEAGIVSSIQIDEDIDFSSIAVKVEIEHTWVGDLVISLEHNGKIVNLQSRQGGSQTDLKTTFHPIGFDGQAASGEWTLNISDKASRDTGRLVRWALTLTYDPEATDPLSYQSSDIIDIPDNDADGVGSSVEVTEDRTIGSLIVTVDVEHTYVGDLVIELEHDGKVAMLSERQGGSGNDLQAEFRPGDFAGDSTLGTWTLIVSDRAEMDTGRLMSWSITFGS